MVKVSQSELIAGAIAQKAVSFPTDTVPALAIAPKNAARIYELKQRPANKPLILMGASIEDLLPFVVYTDAELKIWQQLIEQYWPGALTLVLPASERVPAGVNPTNSHTVGVRVPYNAIALAILRQTGVLATTSANISGTKALESMEAIAAAFPEVLVLDDRELSDKELIGSGLPSTVVCWQDRQWQVLRQGSINIESSSDDLK